MYLNLTKENITLGPILGEGGEAIVYLIQNKNMAAKIFRHSISYEKSNKLKKLIDISSRSEFRSDYQIMFPIDLIMDHNNTVIGYMMPLVQESIPLTKLLAAREFSSFYKHLNYKNIINILIIIARAIKALHSLNIQVCDYNSDNFLISKDLRRVSLLDSDNFCIENLPHEVAFEEFCPPNFINANNYTDLYSLMYLIFFFIFRASPFAGVPVQRLSTEQKRAILPLEAKKKYSQFHFVKETLQGRVVLIESPDGFYDFGFEHITPTLKSLFVRTFANEKETLYPTIDEIIDALVQYHSLLSPCKDKRNHFRLGEECPWCKREDKNIVDFNSIKIERFNDGDKDILEQMFKEFGNPQKSVNPSNIFEKMFNSGR